MTTGADQVIVADYVVAASRGAGRTGRRRRPGPGWGSRRARPVPGGADGPHPGARGAEELVEPEHPPGHGARREDERGACRVGRFAQRCPPRRQGGGQGATDDADEPGGQRGRVVAALSTHDNRLADRSVMSCPGRTPRLGTRRRRGARRGRRARARRRPGGAGRRRASSRRGRRCAVAPTGVVPDPQGRRGHEHRPGDGDVGVVDDPLGGDEPYPPVAARASAAAVAARPSVSSAAGPAPCRSTASAGRGSASASVSRTMR